MNFHPKKIVGSLTTFVQYFNFAKWNFSFAEKNIFPSFSQTKFTTKKFNG
jgi:hypothetical protein